MAGAPKGILSPEGDLRLAGARGYGFAFLYPIPRAAQRKMSPFGDGCSGESRVEASFTSTLSVNFKGSDHPGYFTLFFYSYSHIIIPVAKGNDVNRENARRK